MGEPQRILVTGSRGWANSGLISFELGRAIGELERDGSRVVVVHGAAPRGADAIAERACQLHGVETEPHPADWERFGKAAGSRRNAEMVALGPVLCLAFVLPCSDRKCQRPRPHDSHGTSDCMRKAEAAGIPVRRFQR